MKAFSRRLYFDDESTCAITVWRFVFNDAEILTMEKRHIATSLRNEQGETDKHCMKEGTVKISLKESCLNINRDTNKPARMSTKPECL